VESCRSQLCVGWVELWCEMMVVCASLERRIEKKGVGAPLI
jgi:hypothetical protein